MTLSRFRRRAALAFLLLAGMPFAAPGQSEPRPEGTTHRLGRFDAIEINGPASVRFFQGDDEHVVVEGDEDLQRAIGLEVRDGRLRIDGDGAWRFWRGRKVRITITARELSRVAIAGIADFSAPAPLRVPKLAIGISGAGTVHLDQVDAGSLDFAVSGKGDGRIAGVADHLAVRVAGKSELHAENLRAQRATVSISGVADVGVWAVKELAVAVAGAGRVDYWGTPEKVRRAVSGVATITDRGAKAESPR